MGYIVLNGKTEQELIELADALFTATFLPMRVMERHCNVHTYLQFIKSSQTSVIEVDGALYSDQLLIDQLGLNYIGYISSKIKNTLANECNDISSACSVARRALSKAEESVLPQFDALFGTNEVADRKNNLDAALKRKENIPNLLMRGF